MATRHHLEVSWLQALSLQIVSRLYRYGLLLSLMLQLAALSVVGAQFCCDLAGFRFSALTDVMETDSLEAHGDLVLSHSMLMARLLLIRLEPQALSDETATSGAELMKYCARLLAR